MSEFVDYREGMCTDVCLQVVFNAIFGLVELSLQCFESLN